MQFPVQFFHYGNSAVPAHFFSFAGIIKNISHSVSYCGNVQGVYAYSTVIFFNHAGYTFKIRCNYRNPRSHVFIYFCRRINHIIGFEIIRAASSELDWQINMSELARIWTNGCIIRSVMMEQFIEIFNSSPTHLLLAPAIRIELNNELNALRQVVASSVLSELSIPVFSSCLNYFSAMKRTNTGARLVAAQRDYFGAHGYYDKRDSSYTLHHYSWPGAK